MNLPYHIKRHYKAKHRRRLRQKTFHERKAERKEAYLKYEYGWRRQRCIACNGSGIYDHNGSPPCGACEGTGYERYKGPKAIEMWATLTKG